MRKWNLVNGLECFPCHTCWIHLIPSDTGTWGFHSSRPCHKTWLTMCSQYWDDLILVASCYWTQVLCTLWIPDTEHEHRHRSWNQICNETRNLKTNEKEQCPPSEGSQYKNKEIWNKLPPWWGQWTKKYNAAGMLTLSRHRYYNEVSNHIYTTSYSLSTNAG